MGPYGSENLNRSENFKTLLLQSAAKSFQTCPEFSSQSYMHVALYNVKISNLFPSPHHTM